MTQLKGCRGDLFFVVSDIDKLVALIDKAQSIVLLPHTGPDGDALGATLGLRRVLLNVYPHKQIQIVSPDKIESYLSWMQDIEHIVLFSEDEMRALDIIHQADLLLHLDHNTINRLRYRPLIDACRSIDRPRVLIDHHLDPDDDFSLSFSYAQMSSTCELVYHLLQAMGWGEYVDASASTHLLTGIITDTGRFMYNCTAPSLFSVVSALLASGAAYADIIHALSYEGRLQQIMLMGYALNKKLEIYPDLQTAVLTLTQEELQMLQATKGDTEGLVNIPLSVSGITSACLIREDKTQIKLSLRSVGNIPVNTVASRGFGGGGHLNAAGAEHNGSIEDAKNIYIYHLKQVLTEL